MQISLPASFLDVARLTHAQFQLTSESPAIPQNEPEDLSCFQTYTFNQNAQIPVYPAQLALCLTFKLPYRMLVLWVPVVELEVKPNCMQRSPHPVVLLTVTSALFSLSIHPNHFTDPQILSNLSHPSELRTFSVSFRVDCFISAFLHNCTVHKLPSVCPSQSLVLQTSWQIQSHG